MQNKYQSNDSNGFFITIVKTNSREKVPIWKASLNENLKDWCPTFGASLEKVIELQKKQYELKKSENKLLPYLVHTTDIPKPIGKIIRFVEIEN